jgi:anti-anti-sigma factor
MKKFCKRSGRFGRPTNVITVELSLEHRLEGHARTLPSEVQKIVKETAMLRANTLKIADTVFVRCQGRILVGEDLAAFRSGVVKDASAKQVVLDLAGVRRIDAGGLGVLLGLRNWAGKNGIQFKLMNVRPKVERVMRVARLDQVFEFWSVRDMFDLFHIAHVVNAVGACSLWLGGNAAGREPSAA